MSHILVQISVAFIETDIVYYISANITDNWKKTWRQVDTQLRKDHPGLLFI